MSPVNVDNFYKVFIMIEKNWCLSKGIAKVGKKVLTICFSFYQKRRL